MTDSSTESEELKTPNDWMDLLHPDGMIIDPDGWRHDSKSFDEPITRAEFEERLMRSTVRGLSL